MDFASIFSILYQFLSQFSIQFATFFISFRLLLTLHFYKTLDPIGSIVYRVPNNPTENLVK